MFKEDKRENVVMVASEPLTFEKGDTDRVSSLFILTPCQPIGWKSGQTT